MDEPITAKKSDTSSNDTIPTPQPEIKQQQLTNEVIEDDLLKALSALRERLQSDIDKLG